jgi:Asp-tRNA(Asn)/Glu-tRNA(Gln) amidotransferase A subunit family amidase
LPVAVQIVANMHADPMLLRAGDWMVRTLRTSARSPG